MIKHVERVPHMTSQTYGQTEEQVFVFSCRVYYSNGHFKLFVTKLIDFKGLKIGILCNNDCTFQYEQTHARPGMHQIISFKDVHVLCREIAPHIE